MSLLDKIRQEATTPTVKVPPRPDPLTMPIVAAPTPVQEEEPASPPPAIKESASMESALEAELAAIPAVSSKKVGVRLEEDILASITDFCNRQDITVETLLESFWVTCGNKDAVMRSVVREAQTRIARRTRAGNIRSLLTKSKNLQKR